MAKSREGHSHPQLYLPFRLEVGNSSSRRLWSLHTRRWGEHATEWRTVTVQDNSLSSAPGTRVRKVGVVAHTCSPGPGKAETVDPWEQWASLCYFV